MSLPIRTGVTYRLSEIKPPANRYAQSQLPVQDEFDKGSSTIYVLNINLHEI